MKAEPCSCWCCCLVLLFNCSCIYAFRTEKRALPPGTALRPGVCRHYSISGKDCLGKLGQERDTESSGSLWEGKLPYLLPVNVPLATPQPGVISEAHASSGHSDHTAATLDTGWQPCSSLGHVLRMPQHPKVPKGLGLSWETSPERQYGHHTTSHDMGLTFSTQGSEAGASHTPSPTCHACPPASTSSDQPEGPRNGQGGRSTIRCIGERRDGAPAGVPPIGSQLGSLLGGGEGTGGHGAPPAKMSSRAAWMSPPVACRARRLSSSSWMPMSRSCCS